MTIATDAAYQAAKIEELMKNQATMEEKIDKALSEIASMREMVAEIRGAWRALVVVSALLGALTGWAASVLTKLLLNGRLGG